MRNISFALTTEQFRSRTKTVTRRLGWKFLKPGDHLMGCVKCMGRKHGEPLERLGEIEVVSVRHEPLLMCDDMDAAREGFPQLTGVEFVEMFREHQGGHPGQIVTRIEFKYVE